MYRSASRRAKILVTSMSTVFVDKAITRRNFLHLSRTMSRYVDASSCSNLCYIVILQTQRSITVFLSLSNGRILSSQLSSGYNKHDIVSTTGHRAFRVYQHLSFAIGIQRLRLINGPYRLLITEHVIAFFAKGQEGFSLPRTGPLT